VLCTPQRADRGVEATLLHPTMFRVLDAPSTLAMLPAAGSDTFALAIDDAHLPDNHIEFFSEMPIGMGQISSAPER
jgi:hypothetical protein